MMSDSRKESEQHRNRNIYGIIFRGYYSFAISPDVATNRVNLSGSGYDPKILKQTCKCYFDYI